MNKANITAVIEKTASLARLRFTPSEFSRFSEKVESVLEYVALINTIDTAGIEPTSHAVEVGSHLREDVAVDAGMADKIIAAAPSHEGPFVQVPKVIDSE